MKVLQVAVFLPVQFLFQIFSCDTFLAGGYLFGCAAGHKLTSAVATIRTDVDDMVGAFDNLHIVLDDEDAMATFYEGVEGMQQALDVVEVQTRRGLVEDEEGRLLFLLSDEVGQLYTLVFTTGERRGVLTELDVSEADFFERLQARDGR